MLQMSVLRGVLLATLALPALSDNAAARRDLHPMVMMANISRSSKSAHARRLNLLNTSSGDVTGACIKWNPCSHEASCSDVSTGVAFTGDGTDAECDLYASTLNAKTNSQWYCVDITENGKPFVNGEQ